MRTLRLHASGLTLLFSLGLDSVDAEPLELLFQAGRLCDAQHEKISVLHARVLEPEDFAGFRAEVALSENQDSKGVLALITANAVKFWDLSIAHRFHPSVIEGDGQFKMGLDHG